jgi:hypothetical protein
MPLTGSMHADELMKGQETRARLKLDYAYARNSRPVTRHRVILRSFDEVIWRGEEIFMHANICVVVLECLAYCRICV